MEIVDFNDVFYKSNSTNPVVSFRLKNCTANRFMKLCCNRKIVLHRWFDYIVWYISRKKNHTVIAHVTNTSCNYKLKHVRRDFMELNTPKKKNTNHNNNNNSGRSISVYGKTPSARLLVYNQCFRRQKRHNIQIVRSSSFDLTRNKNNCVENVNFI